jgi:hypothetical protein
MKTAISIFFTLFSIIWAYPGFCTPGDSIVVKLTIQNKEISHMKDLNISLAIKSYRHQYFLLPDDESWGFLNSIESFYLIQVQKKSGDKYLDMSPEGHIDNVPTLSMDTVFYNQDRKLGLPCHIIYHYSQGKYRIRVLCRFSMFNKLKDRYSNWTYFACNREIDEK